MPHLCQNKHVPTVMSGHSEDIHRHGDLDSGSYPCRPNKPDKEEVRPVKRRLAITRRSARPCGDHSYQCWCGLFRRFWELLFLFNDLRLLRPYCGLVERASPKLSFRSASRDSIRGREGSSAATVRSF